MGQIEVQGSFPGHEGLTRSLNKMVSALRFLDWSRFLEVE